MASPLEDASCRTCGGQMERGTIDAGGGWTYQNPATILWTPLKPGKLPHLTSGSTPLGRMSVFSLLGWAGFSTPTFPALLCPVCRVVEFTFELK